MGAEYTRGVPDLVVAGSASRDLAGGERRGWRLGGGVSYGALTAALLGLKTGAVVGVDEPASRAHELDLLRQAGVDLELVQLQRAPVFENVQTAGGRVQTCVEPGEPLPVDRVPEAWHAARAWLFAPVAGELADDWADVPGVSAVVALGWQGLLRRLAAGRRVERRPPMGSPLLERADLVGVSVEDLGREQKLAELMRLLRPAATIVLTRGDAGGLATTLAERGRSTTRAYRAVPSRHVVDPTGAGDVLLAAYLATRIDPRFDALRRHGTDLRFAASAASLVVESPGLTGVPDLATVIARMWGSAATVQADPPPAGTR